MDPLRVGRGGLHLRQCHFADGAAAATGCALRHWRTQPPITQRPLLAVGDALSDGPRPQVTRRSRLDSYGPNPCPDGRMIEREPVSRLGRLETSATFLTHRKLRDEEPTQFGFNNTTGVEDPERRNGIELPMRTCTTLATRPTSYTPSARYHPEVV